MNTKTRTLKGLVQVFRTLITSLRTDDEFDYGDGSPVDRSTDWDTLPECSALTVFSLNGPNAPSIRHLAPTGFVITFPAKVGGDIQIYLTRHILAVRKIGSPAGWAYLGLDSSQKIYMDDDTADVLRDITCGLQYHDYVTTDSSQEIGGQKDFDVMPLFNGDRLIGHSEFARLTSYVRNNFHTFNKLHQDIIDNSNNIELLSNDYHDVIDSLSDYLTKSDLSNYAPLSQLDYYATKKDLDKYATTDDFQHMQQQLQNIADTAQHPVEDDLARVKDTIHKMNLRASHLNRVSANAEQTVKSLLSQVDMGKVQSALKGVQDKVNTVSSEASSVASKSTLMASGVSTNARRLNSADVRFTQLNDHNRKADSRLLRVDASNDSMQTDMALINQNSASVSSGISENAKRLNNADSQFYKLGQHDKKSDKWAHDKIGSLASASASDASILTNHANNINSLFSSATSLSDSVSTLYGSLPAGITKNANQINLDANTITGLKNGVSENAKRLNDSATDTYNLKQHIKKANKRFTDAINSLSAKHGGTASPVNDTSLSSLSTAVSGFEQNVMIDINSLSNKAKDNAYPTTDDNARINAIAQASNATKTAQGTTNASLSTAIFNNAQSASSIESRLISALSKHQLR